MGDAEVKFLKTEPLTFSLNSSFLLQYTLLFSGL